MDILSRKELIGLPVPEWDLNHRLPTDRPIGPKMAELGTVFRLNSTFLDAAEPNLFIKQWVLLGSLIPWTAIFWNIRLAALEVTDGHLEDLASWCAFFFFSALALAGLGFFWWIAGDYLLNLRYRPIRFCRKEKKLFAIKKPRFLGFWNRGDVCQEIPWSPESIFCMHRQKSPNDSSSFYYYIVHFTLNAAGDVVDFTPIGRRWTERELSLLISTWNYWSTFMNHGPESLNAPMVYLPEREGIVESFFYSLYAFGVDSTLFIYLLASPLILITWPLRLISSLTSRAPVWPPEVQAISKVDPDDPYAQPKKSSQVGWLASLRANRNLAYPKPWHPVPTPGWTGDTDVWNNVNQWLPYEPTIKF